MKGNMKGIRITKSNLLGVAVQSVRHGRGLAEFRTYITEARKCGLITFSDSEIQFLVNSNKDMIFGKGARLVEQDTFLSDETVIGDGAPSWSKEHLLGFLEGIESKKIDIAPLEKEIPGYKDLIMPNGPQVLIREVILLEHLCKVVDTVILQPLFKVLVYFLGRTHPAQLYIIGRDAHTRDPFCLGVPNGFVDQSIETCLRWTMDLHKGDTVEEV